MQPSAERVSPAAPLASRLVEAGVRASRTNPALDTSATADRERSRRMIEELSNAWKDKARAAIAWREDEPLEPVLEALALSVAVEITGDLASLPSSTRDELRRVGQRALLHVGTLFAAPGSSGADAEEVEEGMRIAIALARDGLRALAGRPAEREPERAPPAPREIARLLEGRLDAYEAASIARRIRASPSAREELAWSLRRRAAGGEEPVRLAAAEGDEMRDPATGRRLLALLDDERAERAVLAEIFVFSDRLIAVYASSGAPVRVEGEGLRTEAMQPGYWAGRHEGEGAVEGVVHVGDARKRFRVELVPG